MKSLHGLLVCAAIAIAPGISLAAELTGSGRITPLAASDFAEVIAQQSGQVVLINFWASWCTPCLKEIPDLLKLEERYRERGFKLVFFSLDDPKDLEPILVPFLNKWFPDLETYARTDFEMDTVVSVVDDAWNEILPTSYILNRDGSVEKLIQGGKPIDEFEKAMLPVLEM
jgi:thiol-disulfide isomerase/thioredoxin